MGRRRVTHTFDAFHRAVTAYQKKTMTSVEASKAYGVPESTIRKNKAKFKTHVGGGRPRTLSTSQEDYLVALLQQLESIGVRLTKENLSKITGDFVRKSKGDQQIDSESWISIDTMSFFEIFHRSWSTLVPRLLQKTCGKNKDDQRSQIRERSS